MEWITHQPLVGVESLFLDFVESTFGETNITPTTHSSSFSLFLSLSVSVFDLRNHSLTSSQVTAVPTTTFPKRRQNQHKTKQK